MGHEVNGRGSAAKALACYDPRPVVNPDPPSSAPRSWLRLAALVLLVAAAAAGIALLRHAGLTWDEAAGDLFYGDRWLAWLVTQDARQLDPAVPLPLLLREDGHPDLFATRSPLAHEYYPLANLLSAASCLLFFQATGWMDAIDAHHLPVPILAAALAAALFLFVGRRWGTLAAAGTAGFLLLQPRFAGEALGNVKDLPAAAFFGFALLGAARERARPVARLVASGLLAGLALAVKANALFLPAILIPWALARWGRPSPARALVTAFLWPLSAAAAAFAVWPHLWSDPIGHGSATARFLLSKRSGPVGFAIEPLRDLLCTMPEPLLLLVPLGAAAALARKERRADALLLTLWLLVPPARHVLLGVQHFDGVRHFLEALPAAAALGGIGLAALVARVRARSPRLLPFLALAVAIPFVAALRDHFPLWTTYYNQLCGGLRGAWRRGWDEATDYWAASYRDGLERISREAPPGTRVAVPVAPHVAVALRPVALRSDLRPVAEDELLFGEEAGPVWVMFVTRRSYFTLLARYCEERVPVRQALVVAGVVVRSAYALEPGHRAALRGLGESWRSALARIGREAPPRAFVTTAEFGAGPRFGGPPRPDLREILLTDAQVFLGRWPGLLRHVDLVAVAHASNPGFARLARAVGLEPWFTEGTGLLAVEVWRNRR